MSTGLWLPSAAQERERRDLANEMDAERNEALSASLLTITKHWNRILKDVDQRLELVWVGGADGADLGLGLIGQRWHVKCNIAGGADHYWAVLGEENAYREPDSRMLQDIEEQRFTSPGFFQRAARRRAKAEAERQRAEEAKREETRDELAGRIKSKLSPSINFDPGGPWKARLGEPGA